MGRLPLTHAGPGGIPSIPMARQIGPKMNIHSADSIYEAGIREAGAIADLGDTVGSGIQSIVASAAKIGEKIQEQKKVRDQSSYMDAMDEFKKRTTEEYIPSQDNIINEKTGQPDPKMYGADWNEWSSNTFMEIREKFDLTNEAWNMFKQGGNKLSNATERQLIQERIGLIQGQTIGSLKNRYDKAIQDKDRAEMLVSAKLLSKVDPDYALKYNEVIRQGDAAIWMNEQKEAIFNDPRNYDPAKMDLKSFPDSIKDKQKTRDDLITYSKSQKRRVSIEDAERTSWHIDDMFTKLERGELGKEDVRKRFDGGLIDRGTRDSMLKNIEAAAEGKVLNYDKVKFEELRRDVYNLNPDDFDYTTKKAKLDKRASLFPVTQQQKIKSDFKTSNSNSDILSKLKGPQKDIWKDAKKRLTLGFKGTKDSWGDEKLAPTMGLFTLEDDEYTESEALSEQAMYRIENNLIARMKDKPNFEAEDMQKWYSDETRYMAIANQTILMNRRWKPAKTEKTISKTGTDKSGRKVIQYSDGSIEYAN